MYPRIVTHHLLFWPYLFYIARITSVGSFQQLPRRGEVQAKEHGQGSPKRHFSLFRYPVNSQILYRIPESPQQLIQKRGGIQRVGRSTRLATTTTFNILGYLVLVAVLFLIIFKSRFVFYLVYGCARTRVSYFFTRMIPGVMAPRVQVSTLLYHETAHDILFGTLRRHKTSSLYMHACMHACMLVIVK